VGEWGGVGSWTIGTRVCIGDVPRFFLKRGFVGRIFVGV